MNLAFKLEQHNTPNKLLLDFGPKFFKVRVLTNGQLSEVHKFPNTLFHISENRVQNLEREFKDAFALKAGMFTRQEIESAQLLLQADERLIDLSNEFQVERAYTNLFELLPEKIGFDFRTDELDFDTWSVFLTMPVTANFDNLVKAHISTLKNLGFIYIKPMDYLTSSFFSQKSLVGAENVKHKYGILINISDKTDVGVFDEELIENGYAQLSLGVNTVIEYCLAILRDFNVRGFKRELLEEWVQTDGTCLNDAQTVIKNIRKKEIDIKILLNSPYILFDYAKVTSMKNDVNSIPEGITTLLQSEKKMRKNIKKIMSNVIIVGPGSEYRGVSEVLKIDLAKSFGIDNITVIQGKDPTNSEINGLVEYLSTFELQDVYNVTRIEINEETRKALEKQCEPQLKQIDDYLKEIKSQNYYNPENISQLHVKLKDIYAIIERLPEGLNTATEGKVFSETLKFAKEFAKQLNGYKKSASKNIEKATESYNVLNSVSSQISKFTIPFVVQLLTNQLTPVLVEVRKNKTSFEEKMTTEYIKTLSKVLRKELDKKDWTFFDALSQESKIPSDVIVRILPKLLQENPEVGYLDGRFVKYSKEFLIPAYNFLDNLINTIGQKLSSNESFELLDDFNQSFEYCTFLENGFRLLQESDYLDSVLLKKELLTEEKKKLEEVF